MTRATPIRPYHDSADYTRGWRARLNGQERELCDTAAACAGWDEAQRAFEDRRNIAWSVGPSVTVTDEQIGNILSNRGLTA